MAAAKRAVAGGSGGADGFGSDAGLAAAGRTTRDADAGATNGVTTSRGAAAGAAGSMRGRGAESLPVATGAATGDGPGNVAGTARAKRNAA